MDTCLFFHLVIHLIMRNEMKLLIQEIFRTELLLVNAVLGYVHMQILILFLFMCLQVCNMKYIPVIYLIPDTYLIAI